MIELITGRGPSVHVDSDDIGNFNANIFGTSSYIINGCNITVADANTIQISAGGMLLEGRYVRITGAPEQIKIENGTQGMKRYDVIYAKYTRSVSDLIETVKFGVETGIPDSSAPEVPKIARGSILAGDAEVVIPIATILIDGLVPTVSNVILNELKRPKKLWDGEWKTGPINVPGSENYSIFIVMRGDIVVTVYRRPWFPSTSALVKPGDLHGVGGNPYDHTGETGVSEKYKKTQYVSSFFCRTDGDVWSEKSFFATRVYPDPSLSTSETVTSIWGLM